MPSFKKWLKNIKPTTSARRALQKAMKARLQAVVFYLNRLPNEESPAEETVHQLRVWCRRTQAVLDLFRPVAESKAWDKLTKTLKKYRRAAGPLRDFDVMLARLKAVEPAVDPRVTVEVEVARAAVLEDFAEAIRTKKMFRRGESRLKKQMRAVLSEAQTLHTQSMREELIPRLRALIVTFFELGLSDLQQPLQLHAFRVAVKKLRYALELSGTVLEANSGAETYRRLEELQEELGAICDFHAALERYEALAGILVADEESASLQQVIASDEAALQQATDAFLKRWTAAERAKWTYLLQNLLAQPEEQYDDLDPDLPVAIHESSLAKTTLPADDPDEVVALLEQVKPRRKKKLPTQPVEKPLPPTPPAKNKSVKKVVKKKAAPPALKKAAKKRPSKSPPAPKPTTASRRKRRRPSRRPGSRPE